YLILPSSFFFYYYVHHPALHSFPTRRSSDLGSQESQNGIGGFCILESDYLDSQPPGRRSFIEPAGILLRTHFGEERTFRVYETRSEEHTSELQSRGHLVCRLLLEKKKIKVSR